MCETDPNRRDLVEELNTNPGGPYSPKFALMVNRLCLSPLGEHYVLVFTAALRRGCRTRVLRPT